MRFWTLLPTRWFMRIARLLPVGARRWLLRRRFNERVRIEGPDVVWHRITQAIEEGQ